MATVYIAIPFPVIEFAVVSAIFIGILLVIFRQGGYFGRFKFSAAIAYYRDLYREKSDPKELSDRLLELEILDKIFLSTPLPTAFIAVIVSVFSRLFFPVAIPIAVFWISLVAFVSYQRAIEEEAIKERVAQLGMQR